MKEQPHPQLKRFTQQELTDEACPTYKNLLVGRSLRVPSRETILHIAQYLECTAQERNDLLLAARYLPETLELEGSQLRQALQRRSRNGKDEVDRPAHAWLAQEKHMRKAGRKCNHHLGSHQ